MRATIAGAEVVLDPAGALWVQASRTLVVADLHLEKASSFARRGMLLPPYDTGATLAHLAQVVARRNPRRVIALGDSFHDVEGYGRLADADRLRLATLQGGREWIWIKGNHDPEFPEGVGGDAVAELSADGLLFRHEPAESDAPGEVAGHLHPAAKIRGNGRSVRCRAFATDGTRMILPAFGVLAGGLNVLDRAFATLFAPGALRPYLIGDGRLFPVAFEALCPD
ncbi:MAG: ligase-associated DNA damage response endonuclease PdeM [Propylenella sp.]